MKTLFDTSVLVAAFQELHPRHPAALACFQEAQAGDFDWIIAAHSLAEVYAVLTACPCPLRASPAEVKGLLDLNIPASRIVHLTGADYRAVVSRMSSLGLSGGSIYDALIARVAQKTNVRRLLTFNVEHFVRVWPDAKNRITSP